MISNQPNAHYVDTNNTKGGPYDFKSSPYELKENKFGAGYPLNNPQYQNFGSSINQNPFHEPQRNTGSYTSQFQPVSKVPEPVQTYYQNMPVGNFDKVSSPNNYAERNPNFILHDLSANDQSLNESNIKPMMKNPFGQNQSFNRSNMDMSRSKLDNSGMRSNFVELGQKQRDEQREYFDVNFNPAIQHNDIQPRSIHLEGNLSNVTDDTKDLSYLSMNNFNRAFPQKDNSYLHNTSRVNDPSQIKKQGGHNVPVYDQNTGYNPANQFIPRQEPQVINHNSPGFRYTGDFGSNFKGNLSNQPSDLLTRVNSNIDPHSSNNFNFSNQLISQTNYPAQHQAFQEKEKQSLASYPSVTNHFSSVQTIPKQSEVRGTEAKEIQGLLEGLDSLELSKISSISDSFLEDDEDHRQSKPKKQNPAPGNVAVSQNPKNEFLRDYTSRPLAEQVLQSDFGIVKTNFPNNTQVTRSNEFYSTSSQTANMYQPSNNIYPSSVHQGHNYDVDMRKDFGSAQKQSAPSSARFYGESPHRDTLNPYVTQSSSPRLKPTSDLSSQHQINLYSSTPPHQFNQTHSRSNLIPQESPVTRDSLRQYGMIGTPRDLVSNYASVPIQMQQESGYNSLRSSRAPGSRDYHNPFLNSAPQSNKKAANDEFDPITNLNFQPSMPSQHNTKYRYAEGASSPTQVVADADDIVNKMHHLYKDWKDKNAELNQYMNELSQTSSARGAGERSTYGQPENLQNYSLGHYSADQKPRQTMQALSTHSNFYLNDKYTSPYEFRYSMQNPNSYNCLQPEAAKAYQENLQAFMKEDLLQGMDQPDAKKIGQVKQKFKTFSNPIFKKPVNVDSVPETADENPLSKRDYQRDSLKLINKIFDTSKVEKERLTLNSIKHETNIVLASSNQSTPKVSRDSWKIGQNKDYRGGEEKVLKGASHYQGQHMADEEFKPKFKKQDRSRRHNLSVSYQDDEVNLTIRDEDKSRINVPINKYHGGSNVFQHTLFGLPVKRDKFIEGVDQRKIDVNNMEIICINCQEFVRMNEVDLHSETCDKNIRDSHREFESHTPDNIHELNTKLSTIRDKLGSKLQTLRMKGALDSKVKETLKITDRIINENANLEELVFNIRNIEKLMDDISKSKLSEQELSVLIYINRISAIAKEKHSEIQLADLDEAEILQLENKIYEYEKETQKQKAELELWKYQAQMMNEIKLHDEKNLRFVKAQYRKDNEILSQIQSDIDYSERASSHEGTSVTSGAYSFQPDLVMGRSPSETAKSESKKIKFYSMAVNNKLLLPSSHPGKDILISDLYDDCLSQKVPEDKWEHFIKVKLGLTQ